MYCSGGASMHWCNVQLESSPFTLGADCRVSKGDVPWGTQRDPQLFERLSGPVYLCFSPWRTLSTKGQRGIELPFIGTCWSWRG
jgi:hypothetical protein